MPSNITHTHAHILKAVRLGVLCTGCNSRSSSTFDHGFRSDRFSALFKVGGCSRSVRKRGSPRGVEPSASGRSRPLWRTLSCGLCVMSHWGRDSYACNTCSGQSPVDVVRLLRKFLGHLFGKRVRATQGRGRGKAFSVSSLLTVKLRDANKSSWRRPYEKNLLCLRL